jgi:short subunit dehydrogenase-like uncharacterized protein
MKEVLVYGATGLTGALVARELVARGLVPLLGGRGEARLRALADELGVPRENTVVADATHPPDVAHMVERANVVVSCAGPFTEIGEPTVAACAAHGVFYVDSTGEAPFVRMVARRYDATAVARGCALAPACAFEVALADAAAARAAQGLGEGIALEVAYAIDQNATSRGTRASMAAMLGVAGLAFEDGALREEPLGAHVRRVPFQAPMGERGVLSFGSPEVLTVPRHVPARSVRVFTSMPAAGALHAVFPAVRAAARVAQPALRALLRGGKAPTDEARRRTRFQVVATARSADGRAGRRVTVTGTDPYGLSGALLAAAAVEMASGRVEARGMIAPTQVLGVEGIFRVLHAREGGGVGVQDL